MKIMNNKLNKSNQSNINILLNKIFLYVLISILSVSSAVIFFSSCNPSYESIDSFPTGLHPVTPPLSNVYHGAYFRFPYKNCDETQCHGYGLKGGNSGAPSCYSCHDDRWSIFTVSHIVSRSGIYHHYAIESSNTEADYIANCGFPVCHGNGTDILGVAGRGHSCYSCHDPLPRSD